MTARVPFPSALFAAVLAALLTLAPGPARAWLPEGHLATGAMAFDILERHDPAAVAAILRLVRSHPDRSRLDRELGALAGRDRDRRLFELMAVWPDDARRGPLDHDDWHYDQVFVSFLRHLVPFSFGGAEAAFRRNLAIAHDPRAPDADRAVALCWVMHIVGDMHQPLHAALWIGWRFPVSDAGGNWAWVRPSGTAAAERLHWFWDAAGRPGALSRDSPAAFVARLEAEHPFQPSPSLASPGAAFDAWIAHSRALAWIVVYEAGTLHLGTSADHAPVLRPDYIARTRRVATAQIAAAGNRIGALLLGVR